MCKFFFYKVFHLFLSLVSRFIKELVYKNYFHFFSIFMWNLVQKQLPSHLDLHARLHRPNVGFPVLITASTQADVRVWREERLQAPGTYVVQQQNSAVVSNKKGGDQKAICIGVAEAGVEGGKGTLIPEVLQDAKNDFQFPGTYVCSIKVLSKWGR